MLRTCLILSDDPDDHIEISEAIYEVSGNAAVMFMSDAEKAIELILLRNIMPDIIIVDTALDGFNRDLFFETIQHDHHLSAVTVVAYGATDELSHWDHPNVCVFLENDISYTALRNTLSNLF